MSITEEHLEAKIRELRDRLGAAQADAAQYRHRWKAASNALARVNDVLSGATVGDPHLVSSETLIKAVRMAAKTQPSACNGNPSPHYASALTCTGVLR